HVAQQHQRRQRQRRGRKQQRAADQRPLDDLASRRALRERLLEGGAVLGRRRQGMPLLYYLDVRRQVPDPDNAARRYRQQGHRQRQAERQVRPEHGVYHVAGRRAANLEPDKGRDEPASGYEGEDEQGRDQPFGVLRAPHVRRVRDDRRLFRRSL